MNQRLLHVQQPFYVVGGVMNFKRIIIILAALSVIGVAAYFGYTLFIAKDNTDDEVILNEVDFTEFNTEIQGSIGFAELDDSPMGDVEFVEGLTSFGEFDLMEDVPAGFDPTMDMLVDNMEVTSPMAITLDPDNVDSLAVLFELEDAVIYKAYDTVLEELAIDKPTEAYSDLIKDCMVSTLDIAFEDIEMFSMVLEFETFAVEDTLVEEELTDIELGVDNMDDILELNPTVDWDDAVVLDIDSNVLLIDPNFSVESSGSEGLDVTLEDLLGGTSDLDISGQTLVGSSLPQTDIDFGDELILGGTVDFGELDVDLGDELDKIPVVEEVIIDTPVEEVVEEVVVVVPEETFDAMNTPMFGMTLVLVGSVIAGALVRKKMKNTI